MKMNARIFLNLVITSLAGLWLAGCSGGSQPQPAAIKAPAGTYRIDPTHARVAFSIKHLGLSNYIARFTKYDVSLELDPDNLSASSVTATIWPSSVRTDYTGRLQGHSSGLAFRYLEQSIGQ
ncbi:MAG: YceI family protein [Halioglobus sp.]|nr:YceI family protein [Halioglobus sp.]